MRRELIVASLAILLGCSPVFAQVAGIGSPMPGMGVTSPFGMGSAAGSVGPTGVPLGATELATPGLTPAPPSTLGSGLHRLLRRGRCALYCNDRTIRWRWPRHCHGHVADGNGHNERHLGEHM